MLAFGALAQKLRLLTKVFDIFDVQVDVEWKFCQIRARRAYVTDNIALHLH